MNPALFRKLVELKLIVVGTTVDAKYEIQNHNGKIIKNKGTFKIQKMYSHPFAFNTIIQLKNDNDLTVEIDFDGIQKIEGQDPIKLGAQNNIRPDGCSDDAPKRRGRKPKVRPEVEEVYNNNDEDEGEDDEYDADDEEEDEDTHELVEA